MVNHTIPDKSVQDLKVLFWTLVTQTPLAVSMWIFVELFARMHIVKYVNSFCFTNTLLDVIPASSGNSKTFQGKRWVWSNSSILSSIKFRGRLWCTPFSYQALILPRFVWKWICKHTQMDDKSSLGAKQVVFFLSFTSELSIFLALT